MLGIAIAGLLAASAGGTDSGLEPTRSEADASDRSPEVKSLTLQTEPSRKTRAQIFAGGGLWLSDCSYAPSSAVPALAVGLGLTFPLGPRTDQLLRAGVQLGLAGCGASTQPSGRGFFGKYYESPSPPRGGSTFGAVLDSLFRAHLGGSSSSLVIDVGPRFGMLGTAGTRGTNYLALIQFVFEIGAAFGDGWEILVQLPAGFVLNQPVQLFGDAFPDNDNGGVFSPMLLLARAF